MIDHPTTIDIDFLPASYREKGAKRKTGVWRLLVIALFGVALVLTDTYQRQLKSEALAQAAHVEMLYPAAVARNAELAQLQKKLADTQSTAELLTYLRHPWPRSQIVAVIARTLPDAIILRELQVLREHVPQTAATPTPPAAPAPVAPAISGAAADLSHLRSETDATRLVVTLVGTTDDVGTLHEFLGELARKPLFQKVALGSIESPAGGGPAQFTARLTVRSAHGQSGGPDTAAEIAHAAGRPGGGEQP